VKLGEVFRFEIEHRLRHASTWIYGGMFFLIPFALLHAIDGGANRINSPENLAAATTILGMFGMLVSAALFGDAATRDIESGMHSLFYTAPISKSAYLGGRFLGALAVNAVILLGGPLGLLAGSLMPYMDPRMFGPFELFAYVQPYFLFVLPNLVFTAAILFTIATLSRQTIPTYLGAIGLFIGYLLATEVYDRAATAGTLVDPFGILAAQELTRYWTVVERNTLSIGLPAIVLWNRLLWLSVTAGVLVLLHVRFRFAHPGAAGRWKRRRLIPPPEPEQYLPIAAPSAARTFGFATRARQTLAIARYSLREILKSRVFLIIVAGALFLVFAYGWDIGAIVFGTSTWPVTHLVAATALTLPMSVIFAILVALYAGELVWRERDVRISEIASAAPVPDAVSLLGRFLALVGMIVVLQGVMMVGGMVLQALKGYYDFEPGLYVRILFGVKLADYILLAVLAMTIHVIVDQKYLGHLVVVLFQLFAAFAGSLGIRHNLLVYGSDPGWIYSDMNGFGPFMTPFIWFKLYWAGWALLLTVVANLFWMRGSERGARRRIALARARFGVGVARVAGVAAIIIVTLGCFIFYNTNILNGYDSPFEAGVPRAEYERRYKQYENAPQPQLIGSKLHVEIYPKKPAVDLRGTYRLRNSTTTAIDSVHVIIYPGIEARSITFDRAVEQVVDDDRLHYSIYALDQPLQPGDSLRLSFDLSYQSRGFPNSGISTSVVSNGAYFDRRWLPTIGYQPSFELTDDDTRREHGLAPRPRVSSFDDDQALQFRSAIRDADLVDIDAVVGTDEDQIAVTTGTLVREWRENGRRYFHYKTDAPLSSGMPFLSAEYEVREDRWKDVGLRIFHHRTHTFNLDRMMRSMKASLDYYTTHFGPYQFRQLRIVEFPRYASFARAHPHTIAYSEGSSFLSRITEGDVDRPFFVTAHETAHQWWGGQVAGARVQGAALLTETLAQYSSMMVMEKTFGPEQVRRFYDYEMDLYLNGRRVFVNREVPLLKVEGQSYLYYHKGAVAMYTLRDHIGEERVNTALRHYLAKYRSAGPPYPTSLDLYAELRSVTPDSLQSLLRDLFEEITLWDVKIERASTQRTDSGAYRVTLEIKASKLRADSIGVETEVPMNDLVEIGVFAGAESERGPGEPLYLQRHRIRSGQQTIIVTVAREPARAGIDPYMKLIERETDDKVVPVEMVPRASPPPG